MNLQIIFWASVGFMAGFATAWVVGRVWQSVGISLKHKAFIGVGAVVVLAIAVTLYAWVGQPQLASTASISNPQMAMPAASSDTAMPAAAGAAGSMNDAIGKLVSRLSSGKGSDADWQLLQQAYEFMGDSAAAALAAQHRLPDASGASTISAPETLATSDVNTRVAELLTKVKAAPKDAALLRQLADAQRHARQFQAATESYQRLIKLNAMDADSWADYADAVASINSSLANQATRDALRAALKLNPQHPKALWLSASLAMEDKQYPQALIAWQTLRQALGEHSPDAKVIDANIAETRQLMGQSVVQSAPETTGTASTHGAQVNGSVSVASSLGKVSNGLTLFVFAKAADSPAPVAVYRVAVTQWPMAFTLDDSQAMMPMRKLSQYDQVQVQARLSGSGQALPQAGDWQSAPQWATTRKGQRVNLIIDSVVGG